MKDDRAASRYARALFDLAGEEAGALDAVRDDLKSIAGLLQSSPDLLAFVTNPVLDTAYVTAVLKSLFESRVHGLTFRFLRFLDSRSRLHNLPAICDAFDTLYLASKGIVRVTVTSVVPMTDDQVKRLMASLRTRLDAEPEPTMALDPSLIGGFRVQAGDTILDYSITTQLESLRQRIISA